MNVSKLWFSYTFCFVFLPENKENINKSKSIDIPDIIVLLLLQALSSLPQENIKRDSVRLY